MSGGTLVALFCCAHDLRTANHHTLSFIEHGIACARPRYHAVLAVKVCARAAPVLASALTRDLDGCTAA